jgi:signal peptidase I
MKLVVLAKKIQARKVQEKKAEPKGRQSSLVVWALYALLAALIILYALTGNAVVGVAAMLAIAGVFYYEIKHSIKTEGTKRSVIDIGMAVGAALLVWVVLMLVLQTSAPIDAVSSCSMLPALQRGDVVVLGGIGNPAQFAASKGIPVLNVSAGAFQRMEGNMSSEFLSFYAHPKANGSELSDVFDNGSGYEIGLYNTKCLSQFSYLGQAKYFPKCEVPMSQSGDLIKYNYSVGKVEIAGAEHDIVYTSSITVGNVSVAENYANPVVVYQTSSQDYFTGSIIHRVFAVVDAGGSYYFLTKGDNNQALDVEFENYPANESSVTGYVLADVPLVGYVKLLLSGQIAVPAGCNQTILR